MKIMFKYRSVKRNFILDPEYVTHYKAGNLRKMARNAFLTLVSKIQASKCCHLGGMLLRQNTFLTRV